MLREIKGVEVYTYKKPIYGFNDLEVEVGTTGLRGGDTGKGGRTYFALRDLSSTDVNARAFVDRYGCTNIEIMLGGDSELRTFVEALEYAASTLRLHLSNEQGIQKTGKRELFTFCDKKQANSIKIKIGHFISKWFKSHAYSTEILNKLNRIHMARSFLGIHPDMGTQFPREELLEDIAQYIDLKLPVHYWTAIQKELNPDWKDEEDEYALNLKDTYYGIQTIPGLLFYYLENYNLDPKLIYNR